MSLAELLAVFAVDVNCQILGKTQVYLSIFCLC